MSGAEAGMSAQVVEKRNSRILGDMDYYIEELNQVSNRLVEMRDRIFGPEPSNIESDKDRAEPTNSFLAQRDYKHERIVDLVNTIQTRLNQLEEF